MDFINEILGEKAEEKAAPVSNNEIPLLRNSDIVFSAVIIVLTAFLIGVLLDRRKLKRQMAHSQEVASNSVVEFEAEAPSALEQMAEFVVPLKKQRFRKRDRFYFHGRKFVRNVANNVSNRRKAAMKSLFAVEDAEDSQDAEFDLRPAETYLDEDDSSRASSATFLPTSLTVLLNAFHLFEHFDKSIFAELENDVETLWLPSGQYLFRVGDPDTFVYVVASGKVNVHIVDGDATHTVKIVGAGETVSSLLSFIDCLCHNSKAVYKTVCCKAMTDATIIKLPVSAFADVFDKNPDMLVRVVQLIMARVQRVIFVALHQHLGLTSELIRPMNKAEFDPEGESMREMDDMEMAVRGFRVELDFDNSEFLRERIALRTLSDGDVIMTEDAHNDAALVYILSGCLVQSQLLSSDASSPSSSESESRTLYTAFRGECVGQLGMLTGEANFYSCRASGPSTRVAIITRDAFFEIVSETPEMVLSLAHSTVRRLSPMVRQVDFALDWLRMESGKALFRQGDQTDGTFIVLSGRLRSDVVEEFVKGDLVGLVDVVAAAPRLTTVIAVRDSELCKIPANLLNLLKSRYSVVVTRLISLLGNRILAGNKTKVHKDKKDTMSFTTVALFSSSPVSIPLTAFTMELVYALTACGHVTRLSSDIVRSKLGESAFEPGHEYRLNAFLGQQEHRHKVVLYECDRDMNKWTSLCLRQADVVFDLVFVPDDEDVDPALLTLVTQAEHALESATSRRTRKELILIHPESTLTPRHTREWLKRRPWISAHFHVKAPQRLFSRKKNLFDFYENLMRTQAPNIHSDFSRLARHITGTSVGLVLGGGGARGAAHVGMLKAISEAGIPVDKLGGVSMGALVGGLWASQRDMTHVVQKARVYFGYLISKSGAWDLTYPITSLFAGHYFNWTLKHTFGEELTIEDLWLPFFCVSTDITISRERVHTKGKFWHYCRATMTYAWLLPPMCDPIDGHLLMDGCYVNNVPGDVMANTQNCKYILAIDVTAVDDRDLTNYGDSLSGWWLLWVKRIWPFAKPVKIPTQTEIQMRLAFCTHYKNLEELKANPNYEYIQPPIDKYSSNDVSILSF